MVVSKVSSVERISETYSDIQDNLESLAKTHNTDVEGLLKSAHSAGSAGLPYQIRALNLETRLAKLRDME